MTSAMDRVGKNLENKKKKKKKMLKAPKMIPYLHPGGTGIVPPDIRIIGMGRGADDDHITLIPHADNHHDGDDIQADGVGPDFFKKVKQGGDGIAEKTINQNHSL